MPSGTDMAPMSSATPPGRPRPPGRSPGNVAAFCLMGVDKWKAKHGRWRLPEKVLFLSALAGGSVGALLGMGFFRHKTRHWTFRLGMPAILILQVAALTTWTYWDVFLR